MKAQYIWELYTGKYRYHAFWQTDIEIIFIKESLIHGFVAIWELSCFQFNMDSLNFLLQQKKLYMNEDSLKKNYMYSNQGSNEDRQ